MITLATLVGRKLGPGVSGWLIGLPLTSGPISLILAVQYGTEYAVRASPGIICGQASVCIFCLVYSLAAYRMKWYTSALIAILSFSAVTFLWNRFSLALAATFVIVLVLIGLIYRLIPSQQAAGTVTHAPKWDIPARMLLGTTFVVLITTHSLRLGPHLRVDRALPGFRPGVGFFHPLPAGYCSSHQTAARRRAGLVWLHRLLPGCRSGATPPGDCSDLFTGGSGGSADQWVLLKLAR